MKGVFFPFSGFKNFVLSGIKWGVDVVVVVVYLFIFLCVSFNL